MAKFFKLTIGDWWLDTDDLSLEQEAALHRVVSAIWLHERPVRNNLRVLAGLWRCNERKAKRLLAELVAAGKLQVEDDLVVHERAVKDASAFARSLIGNQSNASRAGIESAKARRNALENINHAQRDIPAREEKTGEDGEEKDGDDFTPPKVETARATQPARAPASLDPPSFLIDLPPDDYALWERVVDAIGLHRNGTLPTYWMPPLAIIEVARFRDTGLNDEEIVATAREAQMHAPEPIRGPRGLLDAMRRYAATKQFPYSEPPAPTGGRNGRRLSQAERDRRDAEAIERAARS